jgi:hypothetical protein
MRFMATILGVFANERKASGRRSARGADFHAPCGKEAGPRIKPGAGKDIDQDIAMHRPAAGRAVSARGLK